MKQYLVRRLLDQVPTAAFATVTRPIGIAHYPLHANTVEESMRLADGALYRAKHADKDQVQERCAEYSDLKDMPTQH